MFRSALDIIKKASVKPGLGGGRATTESDNGLFFATHGAAAHGKYPFIFYRIGRELAKKAGLALGDSVMFGIDDATGIAKIYADKNGWKLVSGNSKSDNPPLVLRVTWREGFPSIDEPAMCTDVIARARSISFKYPKATSFDGLAKKGERVKEVVKEEVDPLFEEHRKIAEREERINKKAVKPTIEEYSMKDGKPYGRRKGDKKPH